MKISYLCPARAALEAVGGAPVSRAIFAELRLRGHDVAVLEAAAGESVAAQVAGSDAVIVHELASAEVIVALGEARAADARFQLLFHDTTCRSLLAPDQMRELDLSAYDAALVTGDAVGEIYRDRGFSGRVKVWRDAIDVWRFRPQAPDGERRGIVSVADWGDATRGEDILRMLLRPAREAELPLTLIGRNYPPEIAERLAPAGVELIEPDEHIGEIFSKALIAVELPPRLVSQHLPGLVTPTMLQALASGLPLIVARWRDTDGLFTVGEDLLVAQDADEMTRQLHRLRDDAGLRAGLAAQGRLTVLAHHSASHRAEELVAFLEESDGRNAAGVAEEKIAAQP